MNSKKITSIFIALLLAPLAWAHSTLITARHSAAAALLPNGDIFIAGGVSDWPNTKTPNAESYTASDSEAGALARAVMNDRQTAEFERTMECNFAISPPGIGRFRVNAFIQQGKVGMVMRVIPGTPPTIDGLGLPQVLKELTASGFKFVTLPELMQEWVRWEQAQPKGKPHAAR